MLPVPNPEKARLEASRKWKSLNFQRSLRAITGKTEAMEYLTTRQMVWLVIALLSAGALTAWATTFVVNASLDGGSDDPIVKAGGLSTSQQIRKN